VSRENNLFQAFEAFLPDSGCRVLLVDDVMTTGSTLDSCTRALLDKGAVEVHVAVLARAAKLSLDFSL
jgi:predicted amidophosphoribosyltransferase